MSLGSPVIMGRRSACSGQVARGQAWRVAPSPSRWPSHWPGHWLARLLRVPFRSWWTTTTSTTTTTTGFLKFSFSWKLFFFSNWAFCWCSFHLCFWTNTLQNCYRHFTGPHIAQVAGFRGQVPRHHPKDSLPSPAGGQRDARPWSEWIPQLVGEPQWRGGRL